MVNRIALAALLLALAAPSRANNALSDANNIAGGRAGFDGTRAVPAACEGAACRINAASDGALTKGGLAVANTSVPRPTMTASVPTPALGEDKEGSKDKPGFFKKLLSGKGLMYGLGGAAAGAGIGWLIGGPIGALVGGLLGALGGYFLSKMLAK